MKSKRKDESGDGDGDAILAAAAKQRQRNKPDAPDPLDNLGMSDVLAEEDRKSGKRQRKLARRISAAQHPPTPKAKAGRRVKSAVSLAAGMVTRGVRAGLDGLFLAEASGRRLGFWGMAALAGMVVLMGFTFSAAPHKPKAPSVSGMRVTYLPGPQLPSSDVLNILRKFPHRERLSAPSNEDLDELAAFLRDQPAIAEVKQVRLLHVPPGGDGTTLRRIVELIIALRQPEMPVVLASGERAWLDKDGRILPGILPGEHCQSRPIIRGLEAGGPAALNEAMTLWRQLEPLVEPGLITDICLSDALGLKDQRGLVLYTKQGSRLIWGRPEDDKYGMNAEKKVRDLVHTLRCQGDLSRLALINVRFPQPFFVLR